MTRLQREKMLNDTRVIDEINRHLWIESEKVGCDIGFDNAANDWLNKFAEEWLKFNTLKPERKRRSVLGVITRAKKRGAKSYLK